MLCLSLCNVMSEFKSNLSLCNVISELCNDVLRNFHTPL